MRRNTNVCRYNHAETEQMVTNGEKGDIIELVLSGFVV